MALIEHIDIELAWDKAKSNLRDNSRIFVNNPYIIDILESRYDEWINYLNEQFVGEYHPDDARVINVPKSGWNIRPGSVLTLEDMVFFSALVLSMYDTIRDDIKWSGENVRYSRIMLEDKTDRGWIKQPSVMWERFNDRQRSLLEDHQYVVFTDVAGYFENIERQLLYSDLRQVGVQEEPLQKLMDCIKRWSGPRKRGIPQGYYPSDILSEVYFDRIDSRLKSQGYAHARYSDNLTLFCNTKKEAKLALKTLTELYRQRGLNLQRHKTEIVQQDEAQTRLREPDRHIDFIKDKVGGRIKKGVGGDPYTGGSGGKETGTPYSDGGERLGEDLLEKDVDEDVLEGTFYTKFKSNPIEDGFNQHLFRFLLTRFGVVDNDYAVQYCIQHIKEGKPEVKHILDRYFSRLSNKKDIADTLAQLIQHEEILYNYHEFLILRWFWEADVQSDNALKVVRNRIIDDDLITESKDYAIAYLGEFGNTGDLDIIREQYSDIQNPISQSVIITSVKDMETAMRNQFYNQVNADNFYTRSATKYAKTWAVD